MLSKLREIFSSIKRPINAQTNEPLTDLDISRINLGVKKSIIDDLLQKGEDLNKSYEQNISELNELKKSEEIKPILRRLEDKISQAEQTYLEGKHNQVQELRKAEADLFGSIEQHCELLRKARSGVYKNTPENRKLGRVGQKYGNKKKEQEEENESIQKAKNILKGIDERIDISFSAYSNTDFGESVYFKAMYKDREVKVRVSDHSVQNTDRIKNEVHFRLNEGNEDLKNLSLNEIAYKLDVPGYNYGKIKIIYDSSGKEVDGYGYYKENQKEPIVIDYRKSKKKENPFAKYLRKSLTPELIATLGDFRYKKYLNNTLNRTRDTMPQIDSDKIDDVILHFQGKSPDSKVTKETIKLSDIKFAQNEINEDKVLNILETIDPSKLTRFLVAKDNFLIDGAHRLCALCEIDEEMEVECYKIHLDAKEAIRRLNLMKITRNDDINKSEIDESFELIKKSFDNEQISLEQYIEAKEQYDIIKGRSGVYADNATNRRLKRVGQRYGSSGKQDESKQKQGSQSDSEESKQYSDSELQEYAKNSSQSDLERQIKESSDPKIREHAHKELDRRTKEESVNEDKDQDNSNESKDVKFSEFNIENNFSKHSDSYKSLEKEMKKFKSLSNMSVEDLSNLIGDSPFDNDNIEVMVDSFGDDNSGGLMIQVESDGISYGRTIDIKAGEIAKEMDNEFLDIKSDKRGAGIGSKIFANQVKTAQKLGIRLNCIAAKGNDKNGYYTWARLGYDFARESDKDTFKKLISSSDNEDIKTVKSLPELMSFPDGQKFWKENGFMFRATFDTSEGSDSMKIFTEYYKNKFINSKEQKEVKKSEDFIPLSGEQQISKSKLIDIFLNNINEEDIEKYQKTLDFNR